MNNTPHLNMPRLPFWMNVEGTRHELQQMLEQYPQPVPTDAAALSAMVHVMKASGGLGTRHRDAIYRFLGEFGRYCAAVGAFEAGGALVEGYCSSRQWRPSEEVEPQGASLMRISGGSFEERRMVAAAAQMREALREVVAQSRRPQGDATFVLAPGAWHLVKDALAAAGEGCTVDGTPNPVRPSQPSDDTDVCPSEERMRGWSHDEYVSHVQYVWDKIAVLRARLAEANSGGAR